MLHHPDFELLGAEARHRVGKIPVLADQGLEGLAVAAGAIIANDVKPIGRTYACTVIVGAFQPANMDAPANAAFMDEAKRRSEEHTSELQSLMRTSYAVFCLKTQKHTCHQAQKGTP